ncbi:YciI family protein [Nonomuraea longicatena]|uniref:YciI family protein n=1 Tax=Nonomuraea longicatena TaxID=83682 RepID=A0ABN1NVB9_9ACTN
MRVMVMIKVSGADENKIAPTAEMLAEMNEYNERLVKAGVMLDGGGLRPSAEGAQVVFAGGQTSVVDGPFTESKEIIAGYWIWQVKSLEEAVEWARQCPGGTGDTREVLEIRPYYEESDFDNLG